MTSKNRLFQLLFTFTLYLLALFFPFPLMAQDNGTAGGDSTDKVWIDDFEVALKTARTEKKVVLANFSGSDWCYWCKKLDHEVFGQKPFLEFARSRCVLLQIDFPKNKKLPEEVAKRNTALAEKFKIQGYPTILILSEEGMELARTGYQSGGAEKYVDHLKGLIK